MTDKASLKARNDEMCEAYRQGVRPIELMERYGLTRGAVAGILQRHLNSDERQRPPRAETIPAIREMAAKGQTAAQIGQAIGFAPDTVRKIAKAENISLIAALSVSSAWTEGRKSDLRRMAEEGMSSGQIARQLGMGRGAVCSQAARLGIELKGREVYVQRIENARSRTAKPKPERPVTGGAIYRIRKAREEAAKPSAPKLRLVAPPPPRPIEDVARLSLMDLRANTCRWPVGEPGTDSFGFCGEAAPGDKPYCPHHHHRAHVTAPGFKPKSEKELIRSLRRYA